MLMLRSGLLLLLFCSARSGVAFTPLNYRLSEDGLRQLIDRLPTPMVIADAEYRDVVAGAGKQVISSEEFIDTARTAEPAAEFPDPDDVAVVLFTSGQQEDPMPEEIPYIAGKAAIAGMTRSLAAALLDRGIAVNCINPGPTDTGWADEALRREGAWGQPDDAARLVAWLASEEGRWVTGQMITSDGGAHLLRH